MRPQSDDATRDVQDGLASWSVMESRLPFKDLDASNCLGSAWTLVIPIKEVTRAKSRLSFALTPILRQQLVEAMFLDTMLACSASEVVHDIVVVTSDLGLADLARRHGAFVVNESRSIATTNHDQRSSLDRAIYSGLRHPSAVGKNTAVLTADVPCLSPAEIDEVCAAASPLRRSFVRDHHGTGTTIALITEDPGVPERTRSPWVSRFGHNSAAAFLADGAIDLTPKNNSQWAGIRLDIDTPADLSSLAEQMSGPNQDAVQIGANTVQVLRLICDKIPENP